MADRVDLAAVAGAHGVGGEVRLKLFCESLDSLRRQERLLVGDEPLRLVSLRAGGNGAIARFEGVADRTAAEALRGRLLSVPREALPPLEEGEYYHADLIGLPCESAGGEPLGIVVGIENYGAGDIIEIERPNGKRAMIPFRPGIADLGDGRIVADPVFLA